MEKSFPAVLCACAVICMLTGCNALTKKINESWPPKSSVRKQYEATQQSIADLAATGTAEGFVALKASEWKPFLEDLVRSKIPEIKRVSIAFGQQELIVDASFDGTFQLRGAKSISLGGTAQIHLAPSFDGKSFQVDPSFRKVHLKRARYADAILPDGIIELVNEALNLFIDNINGTIGKEAFAVDAGVVQQFNPATIFTGMPGVHDPYGSATQVYVGVVRGATLVDADGLYILLKLSSAAPPRIESGLTKLRANPNIPVATDDKDLLAIIAVCDRARAVNDPDAVLAADACNRYKQAKSSPIQVQHEPTPDEFAQLYQDFHKAFSDAVAVTASSTLESFKFTSLTVTKSFLAESITENTKETAFGAILTLPTTSLQFDDNFSTGPAPDLDCKHTTVSSCPTFRCGIDRCSYSCSSRRNCPGHCSWYDAACHAWKATCETIKAAEIAGCNVGKGVCLASCAAEFTAKTIACEAEKAAKFAGCVINQEWLNVWANQDIGRITGSLSVKDTDVRIDVAPKGGSAIEVAPNFDSFKIKGEIAAAASLDTSFKYTPHDLGHILCMAQWSGSINARVKTAVADIPSFEVSGPVAPHKEGNLLQLWIESQPLDLSVKVSPPPVQALFEQNPQFAVICAPVAILGATVQIFGDLKSLITNKPNQSSILKDTFAFKVPAFRTPIVLQPAALQFPTGATPSSDPVLNLIPSWGGPIVMFSTSN